MRAQYCLGGWWLAISVIISLILLTACSSEPLVRGYVAPTHTCCARIDEFKFHRLSLGQEFVFSITSADPTYQFSAGRREHFAAFSVPDGFAATTIQSKSFLSTDFLPKATALLPDFIFLDGGYRQISRASVKDLQERGSFWGGALGSTVIVPPGVRYFVVVAGIADGSNQYHSENGSLNPIPAAALGKLSLRLFGEPIRAAEGKQPD